MHMPEPSLDRLLDQFEKDHDDGSGWTRNLRRAIEASPVLRENLERAVHEKYLVGFALSGSAAVENNAYSLRKQKILLNEATIRAAVPGSAEVGELVFAVGHETDHALRYEENLAASVAFDTAVRRIGESRGVRFHDYTQPLQDMLDARRTDEAKAHLGGFNAYLSWVERNFPDMSIEKVQALCPDRMDDFLTAYARDGTSEIWFKPGLEFDDVHGLPQNPSNVEAMKWYYYDKPGSEAGLGRSGTLDYRHHDASGLLDVIHGKDETLNCSRNNETRKLYRRPGTPHIVVDLDALGLDRSQLDTVLSFAVLQSNRGRDIATETDGQDRKRKREPAKRAERAEPGRDGTRPPDPVDTKRARITPGGHAATPELSAGTFPGADHPLYRMAFALLRPHASALHLDATALQNVAAGIAHEMQSQAPKTPPPTIAGVFPSADGQVVFATDRARDDPSQRVIHIVTEEWRTRPASDVLAKMPHDGADTQSPTHPHLHVHPH